MILDFIFLCRCFWLHLNRENMIKESFVGYDLINYNIPINFRKSKTEMHFIMPHTIFLSLMKKL